MFLHEKSKFCKKAEFCTLKLCQFKHDVGPSIDKSSKEVDIRDTDNSQTIVDMSLEKIDEQVDIRENIEIEAEHKSKMFNEASIHYFYCGMCNFKSALKEILENHKNLEHKVTLHKIEISCEYCEFETKQN